MVRHLLVVNHNVSNTDDTPVVTNSVVIVLNHNVAPIATNQ